MQNYASLQENHDLEEQGILFHVSEPTRSRWNHIEDLDSFFTRVYKYHQMHGFSCMLLQEIVSLHQYSFVICLTVYLIYGIDYKLLFREDPISNSRVSIQDVMLPLGECIQRFTTVTWVILIVATLVFFLKFFVKTYQMFLYWDIKQFYNTALKVKDCDLDNLTWSNIQSKIKTVQLEQQMCIHKRELTELDIYHRILRQKNYIIAMVNKRLLPPRANVHFLGEIVYWTRGLRYNIVGLLFWSPWSPFENPWHLREEYKRQSLRHELANQLGRNILLLALMNFLLSPLILLWQILFYFFNYFELVRREPGAMGVRSWSAYARLYLRHFNELDHELQARLSRACRPAAKYLAAFSSPIVTVIAQHIAFLCSAILAVLIMFSFYDNEVIYVEQVLTLMAILTGVIAACRGVVPDEMMVWCPETLLEAVVLHAHYLPGDWKGNAHTSKVRTDFQQIYQYRFSMLLEELLSPILTPYFLIRWVYPRSLDIVDFFRNFTVSVVGVGDVCSFAQMDIRKHGNPEWQPEEVDNPPDQYTQAEDGKVELSLMHFATTNPDWQPPADAETFVKNVNLEKSKILDGSQNNAFSSIHKLFDSSSVIDFDFNSVMHPRAAAATTSGGIQPAASRQMCHAEGPDLFTSADNMRTSAIVLHNTHARKATFHARSTGEETTPLLSIHK